jgi:hypothetical protein
MIYFTKVVILVCLLFSLNESFAKVNSGTPVTESIRTNLYLLNSDNSTLFADGDLTQYNNMYSAGIDQMDNMKFGNINETLGLLRDGVVLSVERRPIIVTADTLFFNLTKTTQRSYQFQFITALMNHPGLFGTLQDSYTGIYTPVDLNGTTTINFSIDSNSASQNPDRFMIVFGTASITPVHFSGISVTQQGHVEEVTWNVQDELNIKQYEVERSVDGSNFTNIGTVQATGNNTKNSSGKYTWADVTATNANYFYRICSVGTNGEQIFSQVVKVKTGMVVQSAAINPNPAHDGVIGLQLTNMPQGMYHVTLVNLAGEQITTASFNSSSENSKQNISFDKNTSKGIYHLEIIAPDNSRQVLRVLYY